MTNRNFLENNSLMLEEFNWIEEFFINDYSFITYLKKDNRKKTLLISDINFLLLKYLKAHLLINSRKKINVKL